MKIKINQVRHALEDAAKQLENEDPDFDCMDNIVADKIRKVLIDMAMSDYRQCDVCGGKAFYDAELDYDMSKLHPGTGDPKLGYVASMAVVCEQCSDTHMAVVAERQSNDH